MIGSLLGKLDGADKEIVNQGLFGFNSVLTGMVLYLFLTGPFHWILSPIGALLSAIMTATLMHVVAALLTALILEAERSLIFVGLYWL